MADEKKQRPETLAAQGMGRIAEPYLEVAPPIHVSTTYERAKDGTYPGSASTRARTIRPTTRPRRSSPRSKGPPGAMLFASGQSASAALFQSLSPGDGILAPRNMYWALRKWLLDFAVHWGCASSSTRTRPSTTSRRKRKRIARASSGSKPRQTRPGK
jgi:cystathionine beta-lyase/cystathionine gamma-synthase